MTDSMIGMVLLAAGASSRMGSPKQLLDINGQPMVLHSLMPLQIIDNLVTCIVLGAHHEEIRPLIPDHYHTVVNVQWQSGMASSIRCGLEALLQEYPHIAAVIISVCDQPLLNTDTYLQLIDVYHKTTCKIVQCQYVNAYGPPTLFDQILFADLMQLEGDQGAKSIIKNYNGEIGHVSFNAGQYDLDTREDYVSYLQNFAAR